MSMEYLYNDTDREETRELRQNHVPVPLYSQQIPQQLNWNRTQTFLMKGNSNNVW